MKRKTLTIFSIVSIIIISLLLLGLTYGYYLTTIDGNKNSKSVEVVSGNSKVLFTDLSIPDTTEPIEPGYKTVKTFTVQNTGDIKATYSIYLVDVINTFNRTQDIIYNLYKKVGTITDVTIATDLSETAGWTRVNTEENLTFPTTMSVIAANETIETPNQIYTYVLKIEYYNHPTENQNEDQGKTLAFKINLRGEDSITNPFSEGTLAYHILDNGAEVLNATTNKTEIDKTYEEKTQITKVSDGTDMTDVGIFTAPDDYGTSYYYRGPVKNNYVNFAGFTWRIVRINGDGSIRLILDGTLDKTCVEYNEDNTCKTYAGTTSSFNSSSNDNAYVGYMYGFTDGVTNKCLTKDATTKEYTVDSSTTYTTKEACESAGGRWAATAYETTHINKNSSTIKTKIDTFYETYIENGTTKQYEKYLADTMFCGDKSLASSGIGGVTTQLGYGTGTTNKTYYAATERLWYSSGTTSITTANPALKCAEGETNTYSRYTKEEQNRNNVLTNGDLKHPIALLSADELVLAGAFKSKKNQAYYLYDAYANGTLNGYWWSLSPFIFNGSIADEFFSHAAFDSLYSLVSGSGYGSRPVINLRSNVLIESGDGTSGNGAYKVRLAS